MMELLSGGTALALPARSSRQIRLAAAPRSLGRGPTSGFAKLHIPARRTPEQPGSECRPELRRRSIATFRFLFPALCPTSPLSHLVLQGRARSHRSTVQSKSTRSFWRVPTPSASAHPQRQQASCPAAAAEPNEKQPEPSSSSHVPFTRLWRRWAVLMLKLCSASHVGYSGPRPTALKVVRVRLSTFSWGSSTTRPTEKRPARASLRTMDVFAPPAPASPRESQPAPKALTCASPARPRRTSAKDTGAANGPALQKRGVWARRQRGQAQRTATKSARSGRLNYAYWLGERSAAGDSAQGPQRAGLGGGPPARRPPGVPTPQPPSPPRAQHRSTAADAHGGTVRGEARTPSQALTAAPKRTPASKPSTNQPQGAGAGCEAGCVGAARAATSRQTSKHS